MIYLDNSATSCPKPAEVVEAVRHALVEVCASPGRGAYDTALEAGRIMLRARRAVARLFGIGEEARVIFTLNATEALNLALKGMLVDGGHVITSSLEHNAVVRPLAALARYGVEVTRVPCAADGTTDPADVLAAVRPDTRLVVLTHASNVLGTLMPIELVGPALRARGVPFLVDAAQTAGSFPIDVESACIDLLAVPGHKGLLGPQGVGVLYVGPGVRPRPLMEGGTGGDSESLDPPKELPERYEPGTPNLPGVAGLAAGVGVVLARGVEEIGVRERALANRLKAGAMEIAGVHCYGPPHGVPAAPVVSVAFEGLASAEAAFVLDRGFGIAVRSGLHCCPEAHRVAGTLENGLVRLSIGHANTEADIDQALEAFRAITAQLHEGGSWS